MATFAVISNDIVVNLIVADSKEIAEEAIGGACVEVMPDQTAFLGGKYDSETNEFFPIPTPDSFEPEPYTLDNEEPTV